MATTAYNAQGQLSQLAYDNLTETRTYNSLMQLQQIRTTQTSGTALMDMQYLYPAGANNGRISQSIDSVAGETVNYTYDVWNRLATASTTSNAWSQSYVYDGFSNLTGLNGAATLSVDPNTNRPWIYGGYDANGLPAGTSNMHNIWDVENRLVIQSPTAQLPPTNWTYDPYGKRVQKSANPASDGTPQPEIYFYGITGQKLATFTSQWDTVNLNLTWSSAGINLYFAGKMIRAKGVTVTTDRLGSVRSSQGNPMRYLPYGQEITSTLDNQDKFGTYFRDATASPYTQGQDYADQRYYNQMGSFWTPDPSGPANTSDPGSWNRYAYVGGDPVNFADQSGLNRLICAV